MPAAAPEDAPRGYALAAAAAGFAFLLALFPLRCHDIWWHLANGREVATGRGIPRTNLYSFTHPDYPVTPTHWLFGLGAYLVYRATGPSGLVIAKALVLAAAFFLAYLLARRRGAGDPSAAVVVALAALAARQRFLERPHLVTMLGLVVFALALDAIRNGRRRLVWVLPALAALWANLHAGCLFGVGLVGLEATAGAVSWLRARRERGAGSEEARARRRTAGWLGAAALACALTVMISPAGWRVYPYNLWHVGLGRVVELVEFRTPTPRQDPWFFLLLVGGALAMAADWRRVRAGGALVFAVFGLVALYAARGIPNFVLLAAPIIAPRLARGWKSLRERGRAANVARAVERVPQPVLGFLLIFLPFVCHLLGGPFRGFRIGLGVWPGFFPETSAEFVLRELPRARVFNDLATGGYLAWRWYPRRRIFIDGRTNAYPPGLFRTLYGCRSRVEPVMRRETARLDALDDEERAQLRRLYLREERERTVRSLTARYSLDAMLLYFYRGGNPFWPAVRLDEWAVVHAERAGLVLARRGGRHDELIRRCEGRLGAEGEAYLSRRLEKRGSAFVIPAGREAARALAAEATSGCRVFEPSRRAALHMRRGNGLRRLGQHEEAIADYERVLDLEPSWAKAHLNIGLSLLDLGRADAARKSFERALGDRGVGYYAILGLAKSLHALGERRAAAGRYKEFLATGKGCEADRGEARRRLREIEADR